MSSSKKPAVEVTLYPVSAAIWRNTSASGKPFFTATFLRSYKDEAGNWKSSNSFSPDEVLLLAKVADIAHTEMVGLRIPANSAIVRHDQQDD
jgi:hypothetical protein